LPGMTAEFAPRPGNAALPAHVRLLERPLGIAASLRAARRNLLEIIPARAVEDPVVSGRTAIVRWHMLMDPSSLRRVLRDRLDDYPKSAVTKNILSPAIGKSLFIAEGAEWRWQRRTAAPAFTRRNVDALGPVMSRAAEAAAERLAAGARPGRALDLAREMVASTFEVISEVTFGGGDGLDLHEVHSSLDSYIDAAARVSPLDIVGVPTWVPRPARLAASRRLEAMRTAANAMIARDAPAPAGAAPGLLALLRDGSDPRDGRRMTTDELRDNLLTFIVAGHETTALTLAWALYLAAFDPHVQERARDEARAVHAGRAATAEDLPRLPYLRQIVEEALRLYPPAGFLSRTAQAEDILCGARVRPGDTVTIPVYALHRHRRLWDRPDVFDPDRFADRSAVQRFAFLPFGDGPRICIGASFALQEAVIVLSTLLARFRFRLVPGVAPRPVMVLTLRPEGGVWLQVEDLDARAGGGGRRPVQPNAAAFTSSSM